MTIVNEWETVSSVKHPDYVGAYATQRLRVEGGWAVYRTVLETSNVRLEST